MNAFNTLFPQEAPAVHLLREEMTKLLKQILSDFIKLDVVRPEDPFSVDVHEPRNRVDVEQVYGGISATFTLSVITVTLMEHSKSE